jgi:predicted AAA+ superfamily ATPase
MLPLSNEALVYDQISRTVERIISVDVPHVKRFTADTLAKFSAILYMVAESDQLSLTSVSKSIGISKPALTSVLKALERSEVLWRVMPNGSHAAQSRKPSKYLFTSPAFRAMYFNLVSSTRSRDTYRGKLLEDTIGLYLHKFFSGRPGVSITFDAASGGADFILRIGKQLLVLEAGVGEKSFKQLEATMGKHGVKAQYGIVVSQSELAMDEGKSAVSVPLQYFLLL